jgi:tetratricopeptide (TPR) repeat protein
VLRDLGGLTRMNPNVTMYMERVPVSADSAEVRVSLQVSRTYQTASIQFGVGSALNSLSVHLTPDSVLHRSVRIAAGAPPVTLSMLADDHGAILRHTEGSFDYLPDSLIRLGKQPAIAWPAPNQRTAGDWFSYGEQREVNGDMLSALDAYRRGVALNADDTNGARATARLTVTLGYFREGESLATRALARQPADHEIAYYRGIARLALGDSARAMLDFEQARQYGPLREVALLGMLRAAPLISTGRANHLRRFIEAARSAQSPRLREMAALAAWNDSSMVGTNWSWGFDPKELVRGLDDRTSVVARFVRHVTGTPDSTLMRHLAGDPARVLQLAEASEGLGGGEILESSSRAFPMTKASCANAACRIRAATLVAYHRAFAPHNDVGGRTTRLRRHTSADLVFPAASAIAKCWNGHSGPPTRLLGAIPARHAGHAAWRHRSGGRHVGLRPRGATNGGPRAVPQPWLRLAPVGRHGSRCRVICRRNRRRARQPRGLGRPRLAQRPHGEGDR